MTSNLHAGTRGPAIFNHHKTYRWIRQIHLWIGAWGALAALWLVFAALSFSESPTAPSTSHLAQQPLPATTLLSYHTTRDFNHVLDLPN